jgi:hypothetical protein
VSPSPDPSAATLECPSLVFAEAAPDSSVLATLESPLQARIHHLAAPADLLGLVDLGQSGTGVANREEKLRVFFTAQGVMAPVHEVHSSLSAVSEPAASVSLVNDSRL